MFDTILTLSFLVFIVALVIGLIKPALILRWGQPTRLKFLGLWALSLVVVFILLFIFEPNYTSEENIIKAKKEIENGYYDSANRNLKKIKQDDVHYAEAQILLSRIDSLQLVEIAKKEVEAEEKAKLKAEAEAKKAEEKVRIKTEAEAKKKAEAEEKAKIKAEVEAEAKKKAEEKNAASSSNTSKGQTTNSIVIEGSNWRLTHTGDGNDGKLKLFKDGTVFFSQYGMREGKWQTKSKSFADYEYKWVEIRLNNGEIFYMEISKGNTWLLYSSLLFGDAIKSFQHGASNASFKATYTNTELF